MPRKLIIIGDIIELIIKAGNVESIPAINIHSPCRLVVFSPKYSFDVAHQANTGVEKPISHAGIAISTKSSIDKIEEENNEHKVLLWTLFSQKLPQLEQVILCEINTQIDLLLKLRNNLCRFKEKDGQS